MIVRIVHDPARFTVRAVTDHAGSFAQEAPEAAAYFPQAALDATPNPGDVAYFEATRDEIGDVVFGEPSTLEAFEAS